MDIPGSTHNVRFQVLQGPVYLEREPHFHREEEYPIFLGAIMPDVFDFDTEINFYMGDDLDAMKKYVITKPAIIHVPACTWHCPLDFRRVDWPILFQAGLTHGKFGFSKVRAATNGRGSVHVGNGLRHCVLDPDTECEYCGRCSTHSAEAQQETAKQ